MGPATAAPCPCTAKALRRPAAARHGEAQRRRGRRSCEGAAGVECRRRSTAGVSCLGRRIPRPVNQPHAGTDFGAGFVPCCRRRRCHRAEGWLQRPLL
uniref:Uncharacterized protein n=1 Tax=Setaria viridis TaxID=4556 RepID=A0A4U6VSC4_SETVI|nr:hypothetical protein SEVIR_2G132250v2 [Setaria viridis]